MEMGEDAAQFAGFTTATYAGVAGGRAVMHARCAAAFTGSHLCHLAEYTLANPATIAPVAGAWIDNSSDIEGLTGDPTTVGSLGSKSAGRYLGGGDNNCNGWSSAGIPGGTTTYDGYIVTRAGADHAACTATRSLACCSTPYAERFRGFTTATVNGARTGGRNEMHQICGAQFPGSHLCFLAEYERATPTISPPAGGAWIDINGYLRSSSGVYTDGILSGRSTGRYAAQSDWNCYAWTATAYAGTTPLHGAVIMPAGTEAKLCTASLPAACCD
jgi:hypothetical protein